MVTLILVITDSPPVPLMIRSASGEKRKADEKRKEKQPSTWRDLQADGV